MRLTAEQEVWTRVLTALVGNPNVRANDDTMDYLARTASFALHEFRRQFPAAAPAPKPAPESGDATRTPLAALLARITADCEADIGEEDLTNADLDHIADIVSEHINQLRKR